MIRESVSIAPFAVREHPEVRVRKLNQLVRDVASAGDASAAADDAVASAAAAALAAQQAAAARAATQLSEQAAAASAGQAGSFKNQAQQSAVDAAASVDAIAMAQGIVNQAKLDAQAAFTAADAAKVAAIANAQASAVSAQSALGFATSAIGTANIIKQRATETELYASSATAAANIAALKSDAANANAMASSVSSTSSLVSANESGISAAAAYQSELNAAVSSGASGASASAAATSAAAAAASQTAAGNSASSAQTSATQAATSAGTASTAASNASTSAGQASTSATNAAGSSSSAATSATNAANSAGAADGSAAAAATSASAAQTSSTAAGNSATAANSLKIAAEAANTNAQSAASAASSSSASATAAASTATTQAGLSASFATEARKQVSVTLPTDFSQDGSYWAGGANRFTNAPYHYPTITTDSTHSFSNAETNEGRVLKVINNTGWFYDLSPQGAIQWKPNRKYRVTARFAILTGSGTGNLFIMNLGQLYNYQSNVNIGFGPFSVSNGLQTVTADFDSTSTALNGSAFLRPVLRINEQGITFIILRLEIEDVTESTAAASSASVSASSAAMATAQAASAQSSAVLSASITPNSRTKDPYMTLWNSSTEQTSWNSWSGSVSRVAGLQAQYSAQVVANAGSAAGRMQSIPFSPGWWVEEMEVTLNAGNLRGVGVHTHSYTNSGGVTNQYTLTDFYSRHGDGVVGRTYRISQLKNFTLACDYALHYAMTKWNGFVGTGGDVGTANDITIRYCGIRPATETEIRDQTVLTPLQTTVSTQATAIAATQSGVNTVLAKYGVTLDVNGYVTGFQQNNNGTSGNFTVLADRFSVVAPNGGSPVTPFDVTALGVQINGNLVINGTITSEQLAANSITQGNSAYTAGAIAIGQQTWTTVQSCSLTTTGGRVRVDFCGSFDLFGSGNGEVSYRIRRGAVLIREGTLVRVFGEQLVQIQSSETSQTIGTATIPYPTSGTYSVFAVDDTAPAAAHTYTVEINSFQNGGFMNSRQMGLLELKR